MARPWAEIDEDWKRKEERALAQRAANAAAMCEGKPPPYPNPLSASGPAKLPPDADPEERHQWYLEHRKSCRPFRPKRHLI